MVYTNSMAHTYMYQPVNTKKSLHIYTLDFEWILFYLATNKVLLIRKQPGDQLL